MEFFVRISGKTRKVEIEPGPGGVGGAAPSSPAWARIDGKSVAFSAARDPSGSMRIRIGNDTFAFEPDPSAPATGLRHRGRPLAFEVSTRPPARSGSPAGRGEETLRAHMPGLLVSLHVCEGQQVAPGTLLAVIEAMKMANEIRAKHKGKVVRLFASAGTSLEAGQPILKIIG